MATDFTGFVGGTQPNGKSDPSTLALVQVFQQMDYSKRSVQDGGDIVRKFYVQPFSAAKSLEIALRGTFVPDGGGGKLKRVKPHADPLYPNYYCVETEIKPLDADAACGAPTTGFQPQVGGGNVVTDLNNLRKVLDVIPATFDYDVTLENDSGDIRKATHNYGNAPYQSLGTSGAIVTATYRPLIFAWGLSTDQDPFDYVDPTWTPLSKSEAIGKDLNFICGDFSGYGNYGGVANAAVVPEPCATFSVRRLMVPFVPVNQICGLMNKLNSTVLRIGDYWFPIGTARMDSPEITPQFTVDGQRYYDITINWSCRYMYTSLNVKATGVGFAFKDGWATWNHFYGQPTTLGQGVINNFLGQKFAMYNVGWSDGVFSLFGNYRPLFLNDNQIKYPDPAGGGGGGDTAGNFTDIFSGGMLPQPLKVSAA